MTASALIGNELRFQYLNVAASPQAYVTLDAATDFGEFGEEKPILDITALASAAREYRNGLADGLEIPLSMNWTANNAQWGVLYAAYGADTVMTFRIIVLNASPGEGFQFTATIRAWKVNGPVGEKSTATFTLKITGAVTRV